MRINPYLAKQALLGGGLGAWTTSHGALCGWGCWCVQENSPEGNLWDLVLTQRSRRHKHLIYNVGTDLYEGLLTLPMSISPGAIVAVVTCRLQFIRSWVN